MQMKVYTPKTAPWKRKKETRKNQSKASPKFHPRGLARNVGKTIGSLADSISPTVASYQWRKYCEAAIKVPSFGKKLKKKGVNA